MQSKLKPRYAGSKIAPVLPPTPASLFTNDATKDTLDKLETIFTKLEKMVEKKEKPEKCRLLVINRTIFDEIKTRYSILYFRPSVFLSLRPTRKFFCPSLVRSFWLLLDTRIL